MFGKLYIYDSSSPEDREQAKGRFDDDDYVTTVGVGSKAQLLAELGGLVAANAYFSRVLVQTHGEPGCIKFDGLRIYDTTLKADFAGRGFHKLFPLYTKIYFDGCNVANGSLGDGFLDTAGTIFLRAGGGEVSGWTTPGYGMSSWVPFIGGHTVHYSGGLKRVYFDPGGVKQVPLPAPNPLDDHGRLERGFKV
ncbi:MAG: hypothetical protein U0167_15060 [bacterium]